MPAEKAKIPFIANRDTPRNIQRMELDLLKRINQERLAQTGPDAALEGRIRSAKTASRPGSGPAGA